MSMIGVFKNWRIRVKLSIGYACLVLFMMLIGYSGYNGMGHIREKLQEIFSVRLPSIDFLIEADRDLQQLLVAERSMLFVDTNSEKFKSLFAEYEKNFKQSQDRWEAYKKLAASDGEKALMPDFEKARIIWAKASRAVVNDCLQGSKEKKEKAMEASLGPVSEKFEAMRDVIDKLTELNLADAAKAESQASGIYKNALTFLFGVAGAGIVLAIVLSWLISRNITVPVNAAVQGLKDIAQGDGDLTKRLKVTSRDEVGELASWFNTFLDSLQEIIREISSNTVTLEQSAGTLSELSDHMAKGAETMSGKSGAVASATEEMSVGIQSIAAAMEEATTNINMIASATDEMTSTVTEIAKQAEQSRVVADNAVEQSGSTSVRVNQLGEAALAINKVTEVIADISDQTNLLALNATIEAARAGEAGKGFAVVATEIKELARQTADATKEIKKRIEGIQESTSVTVDDIGHILKIIGDMNQMVSSIASATEEQLAATREIAENIAQASSGLSEVNETVAQSSMVSTGIANDIAEVNHETDEMTNSSSQVRISARDLNSLAEKLADLVGRFRV